MVTIVVRWQCQWLRCQLALMWMCVNISCFYLFQVKKKPSLSVVYGGYCLQNWRLYFLVKLLLYCCWNECSSVKWHLPSQVPSECVHEIYIKKQTTSKIIWIFVIYHSSFWMLHCIIENELRIKIFVESSSKLISLKI